MTKTKKISEYNNSRVQKGYFFLSDNLYKNNKEEKIDISYKKALTLKNIRDFMEDNIIEYSYVKFKPIYLKDILYVQKNDIIIPVAKGSGNLNVLYIEKDIKEQEYVYNNSCYVLRINENDLIKKYIYILLNTKKIQEQLLKNATGNIILHISKKDILNLEIPDISIEEIKKICNKYDEYKKYKQKAKELENELKNL